MESDRDGHELVLFDWLSGEKSDRPIGLMHYTSL